MRSCIAISVLVAACLIFGCNGDKPTEPEPVKDYILYAYNGAVPFEYFAYHTATGLLDTFSLSVDANRGLAVSGDGQLLYVPTISNIAIVDAQTREVVRELPILAGELNVSADNKYLAVHGIGDLTILETTNYTPIFRDTGWYQNGRFSSSSISYYCNVETDSGRIACRIEFVNDSLTFRKPFNQKSISQIIPSPDETRWYLYSLIGYFTFEFAVYDVVSDSIIFNEIFSPGSGEIEMTPDGRYVFYTYPGAMIGPPTNRKSLTVFDTDKNEVAKVIPGGFVETTGDTVPFWPDRLAVTPDGQRLIATGPGGGRGLIDIQLDVMKVDRYVFSGVKNVALFYLTMQRSP